MGEAGKESRFLSQLLVPWVAFGTWEDVLVWVLCFWHSRLLPSLVMARSV